MQVNCHGFLIDLHQPKVMGIVNLTPDSFYDGGKIKNEYDLLHQVEKMLNDGADFIDMGGQSSRPGAEFLSADSEQVRIIPAIEKVMKEFPNAIISVDTFWANIAEDAISAGASIINDISAGSIDGNMFRTVGKLKVPYILMHMQGTPDKMQENPSYKNILIEVNQFFAEKIQILKSFGVNDIIIDAGYGFGKTLEQNYELLKNQQYLGFGEYPILTGISRKSMVCKVLKVNPEKALNGSTAIHMLALQNNAKILRVHDVKEAKECVELFMEYAENY